MQQRPSPSSLSTTEFVLMIAGLMALNALAIDVMLPAMSEIGTALQVQNENDVQQIIVIYMIGFGLSQLVIGPLTDRFGRRRIIIPTLIAYVAFSIACTLATSFQQLLIWRFLLGVSAGGTRVVSVSVVRDLYSGRPMARIMSLVMTVFMVIPIVAPAIGQLVLFVAPWQGTFAILAVGGALMLIWAVLRIPETRPPEDCTPIDPASVLSAYAAVFTNRIACGYMIASGVIFGALFAFIAAAEQIFRDVFQSEETFVIWFAVVAAALSAANYTNSSLVERHGMRRISHLAVLGFIFGSVVLIAALNLFGNSLWVFVPLFAVIFAFFGFIGPNFNALAMEPLGRIAGTASAVLGFASTTMAAVIGGTIAAQYDGSADPVLWGYVVLGITCLIVLIVAERGRMFSSR